MPDDPAAGDAFAVTVTHEVDQGWKRLQSAAGDGRERRSSLPIGKTIHVRYIAIDDVVEGVQVAVGSTEGRVLSGREREVLAALAAGGTGEEVARELLISPDTVRRHVANARAKLHARSRAHAVAEAIRRGEIVP